MAEYSTSISLTKNGRGVYSIDPSVGCHSGMAQTEGGCYGDCYAANAAKRYGFDFSKTVYRDFDSESHLENIKAQIEAIELPFVRMGTMGDPSEDWEHTIQICEKLQQSNQEELFVKKPKEIVIITKHWTNLTLHQMVRIKRMKICINTSVSALDSPDLLENSLKQYERLKGICKSVLRVVSCDFNKNNPRGVRFAEVQESLFDNENVIDTVFRPSSKNSLVVEGVISVKKKRFIKAKQLVSKVNKSTYLGKCANCKEMCGAYMEDKYK